MFNRRKQRMETAVKILKKFYGNKYADVMATVIQGSTGDFSSSESFLGDFNPLTEGSITEAIMDNNLTQPDQLGTATEGTVGTTRTGLHGRVVRPVFATIQQATDLTIAGIEGVGAGSQSAEMKRFDQMNIDLEAIQLQAGRKLLDIGRGFLTDGETIPTTDALNTKFSEFMAGVGTVSVKDSYDLTDEEIVDGVAFVSGRNLEFGDTADRSLDGDWKEARLLGLYISPDNRGGFINGDAVEQKQDAEQAKTAAQEASALAGATSLADSLTKTADASFTFDRKRHYAPSAPFTALVNSWGLGWSVGEGFFVDNDDDVVWDCTSVTQAYLGRARSAPRNTILVMNPMYDPSTKNSDIVEAVLNTVPTLEIAKSVPFLNIEFLTQGSKVTSRKIQGLTTSAYLLGQAKPRNEDMKNFVEAPFLEENVAGKQFNELIGSTRGSTTQKVSGLEIFTSPQTMVGGSNEDALRPFMSVQDFTFKAESPELGVSKKAAKISATLKLVIHDKSKMELAASMLSTGGFATGEPLRITYGWAHPDANVMAHPSSSQSIDYLYGRLMDGQRVSSIFTVLNSSFDISAAGEVTATIEMISLGSASETVAVDILSAMGNQAGKRLGTVLVALEEMAEVIKSVYPTVLIPGLFKPDVLSALALELDDKKGKVISPSTLSSIKEITRKLKLTQQDKLPPIEEVAALQLTIIQELEDSLDSKKKKKPNATFSTKDSRGNAIRALKPSDAIAQSTGFLEKSQDAKVFAILSDVIDARTQAEDEKTALFLKKLQNNYVTLGLQGRFAKAGARNPFKKTRISSTAFAGHTGDRFAAPRLPTTPKVNGQDVGFDPELWKPVDGNGFPKRYKAAGKKGTYKAKYITFGYLFDHFVVAPLASRLVGKVHEIQVIYHGFNDSAGAAHDMNIASFPIKKSKFFPVLKKAYKASKGLSIEEFIDLIIENALENEKSEGYGIVGTSIGTRRALNKIYGLGDSFPNPMFVLPKIKIQFSLKPGSNKMGSTSASELTSMPILRIEISDEGAGPQNYAKRFLKAREEGGLYFGLKRPVRPQSFFNSQYSKGLVGMNHGFYNAVGEELIKPFLKRTPQAVIDLIKSKGKNDAIKEDVIDLIQDAAYYINGTNEAVKQLLKLSYPTITYGSLNTGVTSAKIASKKSGDEKDLAIARRNKQQKSIEEGKLDEAFEEELVFMAHPVDVSIETIGCPFFNFLQKYYLDFGTNTSIDNVYTVKNITHTIAAGQFKTSVDLTVSDNQYQYGSLYKSASKIITQAIAMLQFQGNAD